MCMSPHEMSTSRIEEIVANIKAMMDDGGPSHFWEWRLEMFEQVLKDRANAGTI